MPDLAARHQANRESVQRSAARPSRPGTGTTRSALRESIREEGAEIRTDVERDQDRFERKAKITKKPGGTLASESSLVKRSAEQLRQDSAPVIEDAKRALKDILKN